MDRRQDGMAVQHAEHPAPSSGTMTLPDEEDAGKGAMRPAAADRPLALPARQAWTATTSAPRATGSARRRHRTTDPALIRASCGNAAVRPSTERARRS